MLILKELLIYMYNQLFTYKYMYQKMYEKDISALVFCSTYSWLILAQLHQLHVYLYYIPWIKKKPLFLKAEGRGRIPDATNISKRKSFAIHDVW